MSARTRTGKQRSQTTVQRRPELASRMLVFEIDRPGPQAWKRQRLIDLGLGIPLFLRLMPSHANLDELAVALLATAQGRDSAQPDLPEDDAH